jgi:hypothetical protein
MAAGHAGPRQFTPGTMGPRLPGRTRDSAVRWPSRRERAAAGNSVDINGREKLRQQERRNRSTRR